MPTIWREHGYRFFFFMADRFEPPHVHVQKGDGAAKLWLDPLEYAWTEELRPQELREISRITKEHLDEFLAEWYKAFGGLDRTDE